MKIGKKNKKQIAQALHLISIYKIQAKKLVDAATVCCQATAPNARDGRICSVY